MKRQRMKIQQLKRSESLWKEHREEMRITTARLNEEEEVSFINLEITSLSLIIASFLIKFKGHNKWTLFYLG